MIHSTENHVHRELCAQSGAPVGTGENARVSLDSKGLEGGRACVWRGSDATSPHSDEDGPERPQCWGHSPRGWRAEGAVQRPLLFPLRPVPLHHRPGARPDVRGAATRAQGD